MTIIVKKVTQMLAGIIFLYGLYITIFGHLTPGGGFAGGIIIAGAFILLILAYGSAALKLKRNMERAKTLESLMVMLFLLIAMAGLLIGARVFFKNFLPVGTAGELMSAGLIPLYNILVGAKVAAAILSIFLMLCVYKNEVSK